MDNSLQLIYAGRTDSLLSSSSSSIISGHSLLPHHHTGGSSRSAARMSGDTDLRAKALADRLSEVARILANEPSLALYRIEEHVRKTVPRLATQRAEVSRLDRDIVGHVTDVDCVLATLRSIGRSRDSFRSIGESAKNALFLRQQLDYERRRKAATAGVAASTEPAKRGSLGVFDDAGSSSQQQQQQQPPQSPLPQSSSSTPASVLESARTFLRAKTLDYSQNLIRRAQATKSVEIINPPPPLPPPPPHPPLPAVESPSSPAPPTVPGTSAPPPRPPQRSTSAGNAAQMFSSASLKPVVEFDEEFAEQPREPEPTGGDRQRDHLFPEASELEEAMQTEVDGQQEPPMLPSESPAT